MRGACFFGWIIDSCMGFIIYGACKQKENRRIINGLLNCTLEVTRFSENVSVLRRSNMLRFCHQYASTESRKLF